MNGTVKTVLIVGGVAVGVVVLVKMLGPSPIAVQKKAPTDRISLNGLIGLGTTLGGLFDSKGNSSSSAPITGYTSAPAADNTPAYQAGESFDDYLAGMFGPGIPTYD